MNDRYIGTAGPTVFSIDKFNEQNRRPPMNDNDIKPWHEYQGGEIVHMPMNIESRAALVEELDEAMRRYTRTLLSCKAEAEACLPIITRLLAERQETTVAEPDAERVERAAKALWHMFGVDVSRREQTITYHRDETLEGLARAALAAAGPEADWLDAALDSVHPETISRR